MSTEECENFYLLIKSEIFKRDNQRINITRPQILYLMLNENGQLINPSNLKYFRHPHPSEFPLDLNLGYEDYIQRSEDYFNHPEKKMEKYLIENGGKHTLLKNASGKQQFCTTRNVLKALMMTPYRMQPSKWNAWTIKAIKFQDIIYLIREKDDEHTRTKVDTYHFKLHQYCFSEFPGKAPNTDDPVDENRQISAIFRTTIDDFELYYSSEMVGVESQEEIRELKNKASLNKCKFVITKLMTDKSNGPMLPKWQLHPKMFGTWIQSFLTTVDNIYVAFRTENGFVNRKLEKADVRNLPKGQRWNPHICKRFMRDFLKKITQRMAKVDCPYTVFEFNFNPSLLAVNLRIHEGKTEHSFLSEKLIQAMQLK